MNQKYLLFFIGIIIGVLLFGYFALTENNRFAKDYQCTRVGFVQSPA